MKEYHEVVRETKQELKYCPYCMELIKKEAIKCRFCGELLSNETPARISYIPDDFLLSVVIPVYNEVKTIQELLTTVLRVPINKEIIIVDDYSTDGTRTLLNSWEEDISTSPLTQEYRKNNTLKIIYHDRNQGKGAALRTGFQHISGDVAIIQDADLEYNPREYLRLVKPILDGRADVVYGSRFIGETHRVLFFWHYVGNRFLTLLSNMFTDLNLTDMETCYKVFKSEIIQNVNIKENRFGFEPEITAKIAKMNCRIYEMPISYSGRDYSEGKKIGWKDGVRALYCIIKYALKS